MTAQTEDRAAVRCSIDVTADPDRAFRVFTEGIDTWWHRDHHVQAGELRRVAIEPRVGGGVTEENDAGQVCTWGHVLTWDPPRTFSFSWLIGTDWGVPSPGAPASRVSVTFTPTPAGTRVDLVHDRLDAHGPGWEKLREGVGSDGGWPTLLRRFAGATEAGGAAGGAA